VDWHLIGNPFEIIAELAFEYDIHKDVLAVITAGSYMIVALAPKFH
jgi:hypothetical protein